MKPWEKMTKMILSINFPATSRQLKGYPKLLDILTTTERLNYAWIIWIPHIESRKHILWQVRGQIHLIFRWYNVSILLFKMTWFLGLAYALDDGRNFQAPQGVSQNRNLHNIATDCFMKAVEKSRSRAKDSNKTMQILRECRCVFFKHWGIISSRNTKKNNSATRGGEDNEDEEEFNFEENEVF